MSRLNEWFQDWVEDHMIATILILVLLLGLVILLPTIYQEISRHTVESSLEKISRLVESGR